MTNSTAKLSRGAVKRGDVLTACFRDIQSQRSIRKEFVIIMILFEVKDYRLLYGSILVRAPSGILLIFSSGKFILLLGTDRLLHHRGGRWF